MGRPRIPMVIHDLRGTTPAVRSSGAVAIPAGRVGYGPKHLSTRARAEYRRMGAELLEQGILSTADMTALELYADAYGRWLEASASLDETGPLIRGRDGLPVASPAVKVANDAWLRVTRALSMLGATPTTRAKVDVAAGRATAQHSDDEWWLEAPRSSDKDDSRDF